MVFRSSSTAPSVDIGTMTGSSATKGVNVSVRGANLLRLVVTDAGNGIGSGLADWTGARVEDPPIQTTTRINFQFPGSATPAGYLADTGELFASRAEPERLTDYASMFAQMPAMELNETLPIADVRPKIRAFLRKLSRLTPR